MESNSGTNNVTRSFPLRYGENFCVDVTYSGTAGGAKVEVTSVSNAVVKFTLPPSEINEWKNIRIEENLHPGNYQISVTVENRRFYIGGIQFCKKGKITSKRIKKMNY
jgi:hypothetical protein